MRAFRQFDMDQQGLISVANLQVVAREVRAALRSSRLVAATRRHLPPPRPPVRPWVRAHAPASTRHHADRACSSRRLCSSPQLGETMTDEEIEEMISAADLDKDGFINEEEFLRILKKGVSS